MAITILVYTTSRFVWNIQIEGTNRISQEEIKEVLTEAGLEVRKE